MPHLEDVFDRAVTAGLIERIQALDPNSAPGWGKMNAAQMLAHCCVVYEVALDEGHPRPNFLLRAFLRAFVKRSVVGEKPYPRNSPTAPAFRVPPDRDFEQERGRLVAYLERAAALGGEYFDGRDYPNFGRLTRREWSNLFHKHLDHHLTQFGV